MLKKKYPKLFNPTDINTDQTKVIYSATSLVKQKEPQILIQTALKNWLYVLKMRILWQVKLTSFGQTVGVRRPPQKYHTN